MANPAAQVHIVRPLLDGQLGDAASFGRLQLYRRLVGLDLREKITRFYGIPDRDHPFGQGARLYRRRQRGILSSMDILYSEEEFGSGFDDRVGIQAIVAVEIDKIPGLAKPVGAQRADAHAFHPA